MSASTHRPLVGTVIGDPCGIGPEVVAKAWCSGGVHEYSHPVLIGTEGRYDAILAMYHDQGHIAIKTWGTFPAIPP